MSPIPIDFTDSATAKAALRFDSWVIRTIKRTYEATKGCKENECTPLAAFILTSCAIDYLSGFFGGIQCFHNRDNRRNYVDFVDKYMKGYDKADIYEHLRCRLAHNYTITGDLKLTHLNPGAHDPMGTRGSKIINFENFFQDSCGAAEKYFAELANNEDLQHNLEKRVALGLVTAGAL